MLRHIQAAALGFSLAGVLIAPVALCEGQQSICVTESHRDATLSVTVPGRIEAIYFSEGDAVEAGSALVDLGKTVEELEVERRFLIWQDKSDLVAARRQHETLGVILESTRKLFEATKSVSRDELFKAELEFNAAEAEFQRLRIAEQREQVEHKLAVAALEKRTLNAPFAGTIVDVMLEEGEICEANQPLIQLVDTSKGNLVCNVEESVARRLGPADTLDIEIPMPGSTWRGQATVEFIAPVVDPASGLLRVKLSFDNPDGTVRPGVPGYVTVPAGGA